MLVHITLPIAALSFGIRGREVSWWGPCKAEFVDTSPDDDYPLRGDVTFLNRFPSELGILPREDGKLDQTLHAAGLDQQIVEWRKDGYDQEDVLLLRYYKTTKEYPEFLCLSVALSKYKMERFTQIFHHHFPKPEVDLRIGCSFHGFRESHYDAGLPTKDEFLAGSHYFVTGEHSLTFYARKIIRPCMEQQL